MQGTVVIELTVRVGPGLTDPELMQLEGHLKDKIIIRHSPSISQGLARGLCKWGT